MKAAIQAGSIGQVINADVVSIDQRTVENDRRPELPQADVTPQMTDGDQPGNVCVLFLAANPTDTSPLRLGEEIRAIDEALLKARLRDHFTIRQHWAVRATDLQPCLLRYEPDIVHFSGHGAASSELIFEDDYGSSHPVTVRALSQLFSILKDNIRCVVLNACFSKQQALAIAEHIDYVIGMTRSITDHAAISFATAFYQALGYGKDVKTAFELGCVQIDLKNLGEYDTPQLLMRTEESVCPTNPF